MVARQHHNVSWVVAFDDVDVLIDGIGGAKIPGVFGNALARGQDIEAFVADGAQEVPAADEMPDQAVRLVLRGDSNVPDAGVEGIRQRKVDNPGLAPEVNRRLRAPGRQLHQPASPPPSQHIGHCVTCQGRCSLLFHLRLPV